MFKFTSKVKVLSFVLLGSIYFSCEKESSAKLETEISGESGITYNTSKDTWEELKNKMGNSYSYTTEARFWNGFEDKTIIQVVEGEVVSREYESRRVTYVNGEQNVEIIESYSESSSDLNSHENGAETLTINELYDTCLSEYLVVDETENTIYFDTFNSGVISFCGYTDNSCADDCFRGFQITEFNWE